MGWCACEVLLLTVVSACMKHGYVCFLWEEFKKNKIETRQNYIINGIWTSVKLLYLS